MHIFKSGLLSISYYPFENSYQLRSIRGKLLNSFCRSGFESIFNLDLPFHNRINYFPVIIHTRTFRSAPRGDAYNKNHPIGRSCVLHANLELGKMCIYTYGFGYAFLDDNFLEKVLKLDPHILLREPFVQFTIQRTRASDIDYFRPSSNHRGEIL